MGHVEWRTLASQRTARTATPRRNTGSLTSAANEYDLNDVRASNCFQQNDQPELRLLKCRSSLWTAPRKGSPVFAGYSELWVAG
jgi:hypothetical protein